MPGCPLIGSEGERGGWASERNGWRRWCAIMVMKAAILEGDQPRWWWGVMRRGCSSRYGSGSGTHAREAAVATVGPGRKTIGQGPRVSRAPPTQGHLGREGRLGQPRGQGPVGRGRASQPKANAQAAGPKTGAGPNSRNKTFSNFVWNSDF
jgi:hypothetical protein